MSPANRFGSITQVARSNEKIFLLCKGFSQSVSHREEAIVPKASFSSQKPFKQRAMAIKGDTDFPK